MIEDSTIQVKMGVHDLQVYLESPSLEGGAVPVDLLKIARNVTQRQQPHNANRKIRPIGNKLKLIVDAENCLDRLYGGYFSGRSFERLLFKPPLNQYFAHSFKNDIGTKKSHVGYICMTV